MNSWQLQLCSAALVDAIRCQASLSASCSCMAETAAASTCCSSGQRACLAS